MALSERFGIGQGIILGVQARIIGGITDLVVEGVTLFKTNFEEERIGTIDLQIDGAFYEVKFIFRDETLSNRTFSGSAKRKPNSDINNENAND